MAVAEVLTELCLESIEITRHESKIITNHLYLILRAKLDAFAVILVDLDVSDNNRNGSNCYNSVFVHYANEEIRDHAIAI